MNVYGVLSRRVCDPHEVTDDIGSSGLIWSERLVERHAAKENGAYRRRLRRRLAHRRCIPCSAQRSDSGARSRHTHAWALSRLDDPEW